MNYKEYFNNKKITVIGVGEHYKAVGDVEFLAKCGAFVTFVDDRSVVKKDEVISYFTPQPIDEGKKKRKSWQENVTLSFGPYKEEDFLGRDLIIRDEHIDPSVTVLGKAIEQKIPVEVAESLFVKLAPPITIIGITGTSGKTSVAYIINEIASRHFKATPEAFYFIDPYKGSSPLSLLAKVKREDIVLLEMPLHILEELEASHLSPHIAVVTNIAKNYISVTGKFKKYLDTTFTIFKYQTYNNFLIANDDVIDFIKASYDDTIKSKILRTGVHLMPDDWNIPRKYYHTRENIALAIRVAEVLQIPIETVREGVESFKGVKGRLEYVKKVGGAEYYNDATSTTIHSTLAGVTALAGTKNIVLIMGGAGTETETQHLKDFVDTIAQYIHTLILMPGSGTAGLHRHVLASTSFKHIYTHSVYDAVLVARDHAGRGDIVLFSPGFGVFGHFASEVERGEHFVWVLRGL